MYSRCGTSGGVMGNSWISRIPRFGAEASGTTGVNEVDILPGITSAFGIFFNLIVQLPGIDFTLFALPFIFNNNNNNNNNAHH